MLEDSKGDSTPENITERYDLKGKKYAYIFTWSSEDEILVDPNQKDVDTIEEVLKQLGFEFDNELLHGEKDDSVSIKSSNSSDSEDSEPDSPAIRNLRPLDLFLLSSWIENRLGDASCMLMYLIIRQNLNVMMHEYDSNLPVFRLWERFKKINCPKLFIIQGNLKQEDYVQSALMNSEQGNRESNIPDSANVFMAYLPNFENAPMSVADIFKEEILKPFDINTAMTLVVDRINKIGRNPNPKFSSTLLKQLYLVDSPSVPVKESPPLYSISEGKKCLAYAFLFGEFEHCSKLMDLVNMDTKQMTDAFTTMNFKYEFCVKDGRMTVKEFRAKLKEIIEDKENMEKCECIMIFISSHGEEEGVIYASDGLISRDMVVTALSTCKELEGKPKLVIIDACRGGAYGKPMQGRNSRSSNNNEGTSSGIMCSTRVYHSFYTDDMWILGLFQRPEMSDVMVVLSSTEGRVSVFNIKQGSYLMQNLCETLAKHGKDYDLFTLLTSTMCTVAHVMLDYQGGILKQQITYTSSLRKRLCFPK